MAHLKQFFRDSMSRWSKKTEDSKAVQADFKMENYHTLKDISKVLNLCDDYGDNIYKSFGASFKLGPGIKVQESATQ
jgi:hypothetical protein